jgi:hypothetical protein
MVLKKQPAAELMVDLLLQPEVSPRQQQKQRCRKALMVLH